MSRPLLWKNPEDMSRGVEAYFSKCKESGDIPTRTGLALHLGMTLQTLWNYEAKPRFSPLIKRADLLIQEAWTQEAKKAGKSQIFAIFYLKARHGWQDRQEIAVSGLSLADLFDKAKQ